MPKQVKVEGVNGVVNHNPLGTTYFLNETDAKDLASKGIVRILEEPKPKAKPKETPKPKKETAPKKVKSVKAKDDSVK